MRLECKIINQRGVDYKKIRKHLMLRLQPSPHHLHKFVQTHAKQNDYFLIEQKQMKTVELLINDIVFTTFQKSQSFLIILLRKLLIELINRKLSVVLMQDIFELVKQYETEIKQYKQHFFRLQKVMFDEETHSDPYFDKLQQNISTLIDCSMMVVPQESPLHDDNLYLSPSDGRNSKSLILDIQCFSQDSKHNLMSLYDDKYFCSEYLTTSQDQKQHTSRSTVIKQLKQQMQNKLKIQPHVSAFSFGLKPKHISFDLEQELLEWKRSKHSIIQQCSLSGALSPQDFDENNFLQKIKQHHYRQKIKSVIVKRRLSSKHVPS